MSDKDSEQSHAEIDLKPKPPEKLAPQGIRTFTVCRHDCSDTGIVYTKKR